MVFICLPNLIKRNHLFVLEKPPDKIKKETSGHDRVKPESSGKYGSVRHDNVVGEPRITGITSLTES
ncbi:unnamed protein product [Clavelina lepadiformis]|uniref:Uncharacterized protein n=1 Tax=Clavelina lepadiformis TaxID=159417 RepID=A0ABP0FR81_CLALP